MARVVDFTVTHCRWGSVMFDGQTNLLGLDVSAAIRFGHGEVIVDTDLAPALNRPAVVALREIWPRRKGQPEPVKSLEPAVVAATTVKLRAQCDRQRATFISYDGDTWVFRVAGFKTG